jgi:predicted transcriptional regulator
MLPRSVEQTQIDRLVALLRRKPSTARQIAKDLECSIPTAYVRVRELKRRGLTVFEAADAACKQTGPAPILYSVR